MISEWLGIPAALMTWAFALYILVVAPPTRGARFLVAMLVADGFAVITSYFNLNYVNPFLESLGLPAVPSVMHQVSDWVIVAIYLPFIGMTLSSPLVKPLKIPLVSRLILVSCLGIAVLLPFLPEDVRRLFNTPFYIVICVALAWGFVAALHSWHIAKSPAERERAKAFTIAFGVRDVVWTISFGILLAVYYGWTDISWEELPKHPSAYFWLSLMYQTAVLIYVPLVAYGVLRVQLFDIDLRIKRGLRRGTVAAAFVAVFFVISELAGNYLSDKFGTVIGILGTGTLIFFLEPIQRAAERFSDAAMPNTVATPEYETYRKLQVYDSAIRAALEDGHISKRQRRVLDSMIDSMGIDRTVARRMEEDTMTSLSGSKPTVEGI
jgi:hypothetical protein